ncbi:MAG: biotin/lipoyl-binding protein [Alphaproteobacteria bacterium]|nr:biotin/lipoyl-binding protein [Alphaproteobacteria bacterium]
MDAQFSEQFKERTAIPPPAKWQLLLERTGDYARRGLQLGLRAYREVRARNLTRPVLMIGGVLLVAIVSVYVWLTGGRYVSTDDAYVQAQKVTMSAEVSGVVTEVDVHEGQAVHKGDVLFRIDPKPFQIALENAKAALANSALTVESMKQDYQRMLKDIEAQKAQVALAQSNFERTAKLFARKFVSRAGYDQARFTLDAAQKQLQSLQQQAKVQLAKLGNDPNIAPENHPEYLTAKAAVEEAQRQLDKTIVRAPFNGIATQVSSLQPGMYIVSQMAAFAATSAVGLVSTENIWIDANMKETDLTYVKPGDSVDVTIDTYPGKVWKATVDSVAAASGAQFSVLPTTNTSGNWVKVVQRIPVRIRLETHPGDPVLRAGMSANVEIDTGHRRSIGDLL